MQAVHRILRATARQGTMLRLSSRVVLPVDEVSGTPLESNRHSSARATKARVKRAGGDGGAKPQNVETSELGRPARWVYGSIAGDGSSAPRVLAALSVLVVCTVAATAAAIFLCLQSLSLIGNAGGSLFERSSWDEQRSSGRTIYLVVTAAYVVIVTTLVTTPVLWRRIKRDRINRQAS